MRTEIQKSSEGSCEECRKYCEDNGYKCNGHDMELLEVDEHNNFYGLAYKYPFDFENEDKVSIDIWNLVPFGGDYDGFIGTKSECAEICYDRYGLSIEE